ncbi:MAG: DNA-directed RNA polymerase subunit beta', partial [Alphaproteobacteria bacterium]|nr:DNA-directed RNA polymerase subunit beta' [Alphaproteobacteria bacterium]
REACKAGISFGKDDMVVPATKTKLIDETRHRVREYEQQYLDGLTTDKEKYNLVVDTWSKCTDQVAAEMMKEISEPKMDPKSKRIQEMNSIYMMSHSGARGSPQQMKQLAGMRGLMARPDGSIIETPILSNFKEGLTVLEYFNSTHGARKGLADTALKTANSGYLTRRLVDVANDCIITTEDCGTKKGVTVQAEIDGGTVVSSLSERILGRTAAEDVKHPETGEVIIKRGREIGEDFAERIENAHIQKVRVRSVLACELTDGVCGKCYGRDLARGTPVNIGEAVGVIAAQSIGEPGTQLTMRTFHIGGAAQVAGQSKIEASYDGKIKVTNRNVVKNSDGELIAMGRNMQMVIVDSKGLERASYRIVYGAKLRVDEGATVKRGDRLAEWNPNALPVLTDTDGIVKFEDLVSGISVKEVADEKTGVTNRVVIDTRGTGSKNQDLRPTIVIVDKGGKPVQIAGGEARYALSVDAILSVEDGAEVKAGDVVARIPTEGAKTRDITGGLPRVAELFEARKPKESAVLAEIDGFIEFGKDYKNKRRIIIRPKNDKLEPVEFLIPKGKHISVREGDYVEKGDYIVEGNPSPHDILRIKGIEELAVYLVKEIQDVYRLQGVKINDKHIEVIVRQMMQKMEITDGGETTLLANEQVDLLEFQEANRKAVDDGRKAAEGRPVLLGITKASLQTRSVFSAASFQETTRVLTEAAVQGKVDTLEGLKENVIVGRLIPAGTGGAIARLRHVAGERDRVIQEEQAKQQPAQLEAPQVAAE